MTDTPKTPTKPTSKPAAPTFPKDQRVMLITMETKLCYREHKHPEGHPERKCHIGLEALEPRVCRHCNWYGTANKKSLASMTDETIPKMLAAMQRVQEEES